MTTARTKVEIDTDTDRFEELRAREPEKSDAEIVESALRLYSVTHSPWVTLGEASDYGEGWSDV